MREVMERNALDPDDMVSCIFTCTHDLDAEFPAVAARDLGLSAVPLLCAREIDVPGALPRVIRLLLHCYARPGHASREHVYLRDADVAAPRPGGSAMTGIEFNARMSAIPVYPAASTYAFDGELVKLASNETPFAPHPQVLEAVEAQLRTPQPLSRPGQAALRRRLADRTGVPPERIAVGNGSCELLLAAGRGDARAGRRGRLRLAVVLDLPAPRRDDGRPRDRPCRSTTHGEHDLDAMASEVTAATRMVIVCNPNNPTATALPPAAIDDFVGELPRHVAVILDEAYVEFSTLQDPDDSLDLLERHPNLVLLRTFSKVYGLCGLRVGYALGSEEFRLRRRPRAPAVLGQRAGAGGGDRGAQPPGRGRAARRADRDRAHARRDRSSRSAASRPTDSQANFSWVSLGDRDEDEVVRRPGASAA